MNDAAGGKRAARHLGTRFGSVLFSFAALDSLCAFARNDRCFFTQRREVKLKALRKSKFRHSMPTAHRPLPTAHCLPLTAHCPLLTAFHAAPPGVEYTPLK